MLSEKLLSFALLGIDPVLWVLVAMSIIAVGVMIERALAFHQIQKNYKDVDYYTLRLNLEAHLGILATFGNNVLTPEYPYTLAGEYPYSETGKFSKDKSIT